MFSNFIYIILLVLSHSFWYLILYPLCFPLMSQFEKSLSSVSLILSSSMLSPDYLLKQFSTSSCFWFLLFPFDSSLVFSSLCLITCLCILSNFPVDALKINNSYLKFSDIFSICPIYVLMIIFVSSNFTLGIFCNVLC